MFTLDEIIRATKGKLICGSKEAGTIGVSIDSRDVKPGDIFIAIKGENFDGHKFVGEAAQKKAGCIIVHGSKFMVQSSKNTPIIKVKDTTKALGDLARFHRARFNVPVIVVTGSNGKTTTKEMIACVLAQKSRVLKNIGTKNNHIGLPMALLGLDRSHDFAVLEAGTNHPGEIAYLAGIACPNIGVITNVGPSHLEFLNDLKGVFKEKYSLLKYLSSPKIAIFNADDPLLKKEINKNTKNPFILSFGIKQKSDFSADAPKIRNGNIEFFIGRHKITLPTPAGHNIHNALAAIAVARLFSRGYNEIAFALKDFSFPAGRLNLLECHRIRFIDDTYNSNPLSLSKALDVLRQVQVKGRKIFVMGDMLELGNLKEVFHREAGKKAAEVCDVFISVGELSKLSARQAHRLGFKQENLFSCASSKEARNIVFNRVCAGPDDIVLVKGSRGMRMEEVFKKI